MLVVRVKAVLGEVGRLSVVEEVIEGCYYRLVDEGVEG